MVPPRGRSRRMAVLPSLRRGYRAYANPMPGTEAVVLDGDGRVLLGRRAFAPSAGLWDLPGGFLDEQEDPVTALRREVREETGLEIELGGFVGFYLEPYDGRTVLCLTWRAHAQPGKRAARRRPRRARVVRARRDPSGRARVRSLPARAVRRSRARAPVGLPARRGTRSASGARPARRRRRPRAAPTLRRR